MTVEEGGELVRCLRRETRERELEGTAVGRDLRDVRLAVIEAEGAAGAVALVLADSQRGGGGLCAPLLWREPKLALPGELVADRVALGDGIGVVGFECAGSVRAMAGSRWRCCGSEATLSLLSSLLEDEEKLKRVVPPPAAARGKEESSELLQIRKQTSKGG